MKGNDTDAVCRGGCQGRELTLNLQLEHEAEQYLMLEWKRVDHVTRLLPHSDNKIGTTGFGMIQLVI